MPAIPRRVVTGHDENRSRQTARMAFILVDGCFTVELLDSLGGDVLGGLLHDPLQHGPMEGEA